MTGITQGSTSVAFGYDAAARRTSLTLPNGIVVESAYDTASRLTGLTYKLGAATLGTLDEFLTRTDAAGTRYFLPDALGSTLALTDALGVVDTEYAYEPFGGTTASGASSANSFQYTGRENDGTDLYYYRARYYSAVSARFITEDPISFAGGDVNFYAYVGNSPTNYSNALGLARCCDRFEYWMNCVAVYRLDLNALTVYNLGNTAGNAMVGTGRTGVAGSPPHSTSWQHKVGGTYGGPRGSRIGRAVGRLGLLPTVAEGFYDIGVMMACTYICVDCD